MNVTSVKVSVIFIVYVTFISRSHCLMAGGFLFISLSDAFLEVIFHLKNIMFP